MFLPVAPVQRTQEARVLETAREMLGRPMQDWLIPRLNGQLRLRKPPLPYWLSAVGFSAFGVSAFAGRLPAALAGWLTLAAIYLLGKHLFTQRTGLLAAAMLLGSYMFFRHTRLAETDALASFFVTGAIASLCRAAYSSTPPPHHSNTPSRSLAFFHLFALFTALAALSKGPPAFFPILFFVALCFLDRTLPLRFIKSGAPLTLLLSALPWWLYAYLRAGSEQINHELERITLGGEHARPFYNYFPQLLIAVAPWTGFVLLALLAAWSHRKDARIQILLLWLASILIPLLIIPQRQVHYLLPAMPPLLLLAGWSIDLALRCGTGFQPVRTTPHARNIHITIYITAALLICAAPLVHFVKTPQAPAREPVDFAIAALIVITAAATIFITYRRGIAAGIAALTATSILTLTPLIGYWSPIHFDRDPASEARQLTSRFPASTRYYFYGETLSLPLVFTMRREMPLLPPTTDPRTLPREPDVVLLTLSKEGRPPAAPPPPFVQAHTIESDQRILYAYQPQP